MIKQILFLVCVTAGINAHTQDVRAVKITALDSVIRHTSRPLIINFWATWCMPCIEELPYFRKQAALHAKDSVELILVSLDMKDDYPQKVNAFVAKYKISTPVLWLNESNADYFCPVIDSVWSGSIPATLFINPYTNYRRFFEQQLKEDLLVKQIREMLAAKKN